MKTRLALLLCVLAASLRGADAPAPATDKGEKSDVIATAPATVPGVSIEKVAFHGWKDAWKISNAACELIVVPQVSRVMSFSLKGGENLIWIAPTANGQVYPQASNEWRNIGGDKIWPEPQAVWGWPPPYFFDNAPSDAEAIPGGVRILTQKVSPRLGSILVREFVLDAEKARVTVRQHFEKSVGEPIPMTLWNITQVRKPEYALLPLGAEDDKKLRYRGFGDKKIEAPALQIHDTVLSLRNDEAGPKVGVRPLPDGSNRWVAAVYPSCLLLESRQIEKGAAYPDENCNAELFASPANLGTYIELELLSPVKALKPGETLADDSVWQLVPLTPAQAKDPEQAAAAARAALVKP